MPDTVTYPLDTLAGDVTKYMKIHKSPVGAGDVTKYMKIHKSPVGSGLAWMGCT
jgi:hypothetical protein